MKNVTLFINSLARGGAERVVSVIIHQLVKEGIKVNLLCIEKDNKYSIPKEVNITYLSTLTKHDSNLKKFFYLPILAMRLKKYIKDHNVKLIQSHIYRANFVNLLAKAFGSKHEVQVVEVISINYFLNGGVTQKINLKLIQWLYKYADLVIFKAQRMKEEFLKQFPNTKNYRVINNPYDISKIQTLANEKSFKDFEFQESKQYLVTVGRLNVQKRQITLIKALKSLDEKVELLIIGEGEEEEKLKTFTHSHQLDKRVHFLGHQENPFKYIKNADIFVLASTKEGFPNVLVEAMLCKTPVISTDCISGPREILAPNSDINYQLSNNIEYAKNGILYPVNQHDSLIKAISTLINNEVKKDIYKTNAFTKAQEYALENIIQKYKEALCVD